uniref:Ral GTPase-activating protein subunit alpha/beta N-terminal domain-containing protein n=1 Tax=Parascaris equorum TaxID=6256 RepID=A0A914RCQ4_PAREQ
MAPKMTQTLLDEFLRAARAELIPYPSYWKTLSVLCRRWRHQASLVRLHRCYLAGDCSYFSILFY